MFLAKVGVFALFYDRFNRNIKRRFLSLRLNLGCYYFPVHFFFPLMSFLMSLLHLTLAL